MLYRYVSHKSRTCGRVWKLRPRGPLVERIFDPDMIGKDLMKHKDFTQELNIKVEEVVFD